MWVIRSFFALLFCLVCTFGCKKNDSHTSNSCRIAVCYDTLLLPSGNETSVTRIFYDNDGRVAYTLYNSLNSSSSRVFIYNDSSFVITPTNSLSPKDTIITNSKGMPLRVKHTFTANNYYDLSTYAYDASGLLQSIAYKQASISGGNLRTATNTYTFVNGDCVSSTYTDANGTSTTKYTYYTDRPAQEGDYRSFQDITNYGVVTLRNKHLLRSSQSGSYTGGFSYTFDNDGKIATATYREANLVFKKTYVYDCSQ